MTILDYHRLKASELEALDLARLEAEVRAESAAFPETVESLLPPPEEKHLRREGWPHYERFRSLCELYLGANAAQRQFIRSRINWTRAYQLGLFRSQARELAMETKSEHLLRLALVSLVIDYFNVGDSRDAILSLQRLLVAARHIGIDWSALVLSVADTAGDGMAALYRDFLKNHPA